MITATTVVTGIYREVTTCQAANQGEQDGTRVLLRTHSQRIAIMLSLWLLLERLLS